MPPGRTVIVEKIFSLAGVGSLLVDSITTRDYAVIQLATLIFAVLVVATNLAGDLIYRLLDPGAEAIDAGAHVGLMSAIMALRVGPSGCVHSFEPNPAVYAKLSANAGRINARLGSVVIRTHDLALSDSARQAQLFLPDDWSKNTGVARLDATGNAAATVECRTLDDFGDDSGITSPALMKIDVEGHELAVLRGAPRTLAQLRDVVFEDFGAYPTPAMALLEQQYGTRESLLRQKMEETEREGIEQLVETKLILNDFKVSGYVIPENVIEGEINRRMTAALAKAKETAAIKAETGGYSAGRCATCDPLTSIHDEFLPDH